MSSLELMSSCWVLTLASKVPADMGKGALFSSTSGEVVPLANFFVGCGVGCPV